MFALRFARGWVWAFTDGVANDLIDGFSRPFCGNARWFLERKWRSSLIPSLFQAAAANAPSWITLPLHLAHFYLLRVIEETLSRLMAFALILGSISLNSTRLRFPRLRVLLGRIEDIEWAGGVLLIGIEEVILEEYPVFEAVVEGGGYLLGGVEVEGGGFLGGV